MLSEEYHSHFLMLSDGLPMDYQWISNFLLSKAFYQNTDQITDGFVFVGNFVGNHHVFFCSDCSLHFRRHLKTQFQKYAKKNKRWGGLDSKRRGSVIAPDPMVKSFLFYITICLNFFNKHKNIYKYMLTVTCYCSLFPWLTPLTFAKEFYVYGSRSYFSWLDEYQNIC